jgi:antitoxin VapB
MTKPQKAKLFMTGGSQAVRLPAEFRFAGKEVRIRRDATSGEIILSPVETWDEYFEWAQKQDWGPPLEREQPMDDFIDRTGLSEERAPHDGSENSRPRKASRRVDPKAAIRKPASKRKLPGG